MTNKLAIVVGSVALVIIAALLFHGHGLKTQLKESQEDYADEKLRSKRAQRQNVDYETKIRDLEVALRQKNEQQNGVQAELDEAEQQIQENADFMTEIQGALEQMAVRFNIDIDAEETIATTVIQTLGDRLQEILSGLRAEADAAADRANADAAAAKAALEDELADAHAKLDASAKDLTALKDGYKKLSAAVSALIAGGDAAAATDVKTQIDKQVQTVDDKLKQATATKAPAPTTQAPTKAAPPPPPADDGYGLPDGADADNTDADANTDNTADTADAANTSAGNRASTGQASPKNAQYTSSTGEALQTKGKKRGGGKQQGGYSN